MGRLKSSLTVAQAVHRLVRLGGMPEPRWLAAAERWERGREGAVADRGWAAEPRPPLLTPPPTLPPSPRLGLHVRAPTPKQRPAVGRPPRLVFPEDRAARSMLARRPEVQKRGGGGGI
jgi:hypothetical protein